MLAYLCIWVWDIIPVPIIPILISFKKKFLLIFHNQPPAPLFLLRKFRPLSPYLEAGIWHSKLMISDLANFTKMFILNLLYYTIYPGSKTPYGFDFFCTNLQFVGGFDKSARNINSIRKHLISFPIIHIIKKNKEVMKVRLEEFFSNKSCFGKLSKNSIDNHLHRWFGFCPFQF